MVEKCNHAYFLYKGSKHEREKSSLVGVNITEDHLFDLIQLSGLGKRKDNGEVDWINPPTSDIFDRRKSYIEVYKFCPKCGKKLNFNKFKKLAFDTENEMYH